MTHKMARTRTGYMIGDRFDLIRHYRHRGTEGPVLNGWVMSDRITGIQTQPMTLAEAEAAATGRLLSDEAIRTVVVELRATSWRVLSFSLGGTTAIGVSFDSDPTREQAQVFRGHPVRWDEDHLFEVGAVATADLDSNVRALLEHLGMNSDEMIRLD